MVFADSVLCLGQTNESKEAKVRWEDQVQGLRMHLSFQQVVGIDEEIIEFERNIFQDFHH